MDEQAYCFSELMQYYKCFQGRVESLVNRVKVMASGEASGKKKVVISIDGSKEAENTVNCECHQFAALIMHEIRFSSNS